MATYQLPGVKRHLDQGATIQPWYLYPVGQPEGRRYADLQMARNQPMPVQFLQTLAPTIASSLDWMQTTVDVVWT